MVESQSTALTTWPRSPYALHYTIAFYESWLRRKFYALEFCLRVEVAFCEELPQKPIEMLSATQLEIDYLSICMG